MIILVEGGQKCGKSEYAESIFRATNKPGKYVATMIPYGEYGDKIIERHLKLRAGLMLDTIEDPYLDCYEMMRFEGSVILEDISNLVANYYFVPPDGMPKYEDSSIISQIIVNRVRMLSTRCDELIIVGMKNLDDSNYDNETKNYIDTMDVVMRQIGEISDVVVLVENNIPHCMKGKLPAAVPKRY